MADQAGDYLSGSKDPTYPDSRNYKFTYPSSMEAQIRKLRLSLEHWREIVLQTKRILLWEKNWHPTALIGGNTILYTLLWLLEPSILGVVSLFGLFFTILDYLMPSIATSFFKSETWTVKKEKEFEDLCTSLIIHKAKAELAWGSYYKMRSTNRKMYFLVTITTFSILAWIGCTFNNLFLAYVLVTFLLLLPGMEQNGVMSKWRNSVQTFISEFIKQAKTKVGQEKKED